MTRTVWRVAYPTRTGLQSLTIDSDHPTEHAANQRATHLAATGETAVIYQVTLHEGTAA